MSIEDALLTATTIHNATPHTSTGYSPFYLLHGFEPSLPGLQLLKKEQQSSTSHLDEVQAVRLQELSRASINSEPRLRITEKNIKINDWVVYLLPMHDVKTKQDVENKFNTMWSLPAKVVSVNDKVVKLEEWATRKEVQVPITKVRVLQGEVPISLREVNLHQLESSLPSNLRVQGARSVDSPTPWSEFLTKAKDQLPVSSVNSSKKRRRS